MKILINTVCFYPNIGGLETMNMLLCSGLAKRGHQVTVLAPSYPEKDYDDSAYPFRIIRQASSLTLFKEYLKCDVFFHRQISLKAVWPVMLWPFKKWVCSYHMCEFDNFDNGTIKGRLKMFFSKFPHNIAVSKKVAECLCLPNATIIPNAYNNQLFIDKKNKERNGFIYVGRLVSVKGILLLIDAFDQFVKQYPENKNAHLTIVGDGEEREEAERFVRRNNLGLRVRFKGMLKGKELVDEMNRHLCQVVPSIYNEAFGIVALEAMATGCIALVSDGDGLQEAIGDCGFTFKKGNVDDLYNKLSIVADLSCAEIVQLKRKAMDRCSEFTPEEVVNRYEKVLIG